MSTYFERCPAEVEHLCKKVLKAYPEHKELLDAGVKIDLVFAISADANGMTGRPALTLHGRPCAGIARIIKLKDRVMGRGDVEVALDGKLWEKSSAAERLALLDHELYHFAPFLKQGVLQKDDANRPIIKMRPHDYDFGWFKVIAERHGDASGEVQQAKLIMERAGDKFWPELFPREVLEKTGVAVVAAALSKRRRR